MEPIRSQPTDKDAENPPVSGNQAKATEAPPAYGSWLDQLKDAQRTSSNPQDYVKKSGQAVYNTKASIPTMLLLLPIPLSQIIVGALNLNNCPTQRLIPIWMIVSGSVFLAMKGAAIIDKLLNPNSDDEDTRGNKFFRQFQSISSLFLFVWLICGSVWVFGKYRPELRDPSSPNYCHGGTYFYAFVLLIMAYVFMFFFGCCCGCLCYTAKPDKTESPSEP